MVPVYVVYKTMAEVVRSNFSVLLPLIEDCINRSEFLGKERSLKAKRKGVKEERERGSSLGTRGAGSERVWFRD